ncbi:hypothetical protein [Angustibacter aerolatus]
MTDTTVRDPADDDLAELLAPPGRRASRLTWVLAALILAVGSFAAGALAHGQGATAQAVAGPTGTRGQGFTGGEGFPAGGFGQPGAAAGGAVSGSGAAAAGSSAGATALPAVIGTVVEVDGRTLTVRNLGGRTVKVIVPDGVDVTTTSAGPLSKLAEGSSVVVTGTTAADGAVTASGVTERSTK